MLKTTAASLLVMAVLTSCAAPQKPRKLTEDDKSLYAIGLVMARQLTPFALTDYELELVKTGLSDGVNGREPLVDFATYSKKSQDMAIGRRDAHGRWLEDRADEFLKTEAEKPGATRTKSGIIYQPLKEGTGTAPTPSSTIRVHYTSTLLDGREMESTYKNGAPDELHLGEFMACLKEGVQLMKQGGKARIICPPETALGKQGDGFIPPNATLVFTIELLEVK